MINIQNVRQSRENEINKKVEEIKDSNINNEEKRLIVLNDMNSSDDDSQLDKKFFKGEQTISNSEFSEIKLFDLDQVREYREKKIESKIFENNDNLAKEEKRLIALDEMNSSFSSDSTEEVEEVNKMLQNLTIKMQREMLLEIKEKEINQEKSNIQPHYKEQDNKPNNYIDQSQMVNNTNNTNIIISPQNDISDITRSSSEISTMVYSKIVKADGENSEQSTMSSSILVKPDDEKKKYWIKYKLYDVVKNDNESQYPYICKIDEDKRFYFYDNKLVTYNYAQNVLFGEKYSINEDILKDETYNESLGLFFCGKKIELNQKEVKRCCPNEIMCKECMNKNKNRYNLNNQYAININGRAARINNGKFHCFGHFSIGKQIENCVNKFSCEACLLLNKYKSYYFSEDN